MDRRRAEPRPLYRHLRATVAKTLPGSWIVAAARASAIPDSVAHLPGWRFGDARSPNRSGFWLREQFWKLARDNRLDAPLRLRWHHGLEVELDLGSDLSRCLFVAGVVDPNEFAFLERILEPGMHFVDVGANVGIYSLFAASRVAPRGRVTAFEPSPREFARLRRNVELNKLAAIETLPLALSDHAGTAELVVSDQRHEGQSTLGSLSYQGVGSAGIEKVRLAKLDDLAREQRWPRIDFMKIDVEGGELAVLRGATRVLAEQRPALMVELLDAALASQETSSEDVRALLQAAGYAIYRFDPSSGSLAPGHGESGLNVVAMPAERPLPSDNAQSIATRDSR